MPKKTKETTKKQTNNIEKMQNTEAIVTQALMDAEEVFKLIGRIEAADFLTTVGDVITAQTFEKLRKSKAYKDIPISDGAGNVRYVGDFKEFCEVKLGKSYTRCHELSQNLRALGADLYESAEKIGFRARDYRALKALPPEEQEVVKQALESESKDEVLTILEDLTERHVAEKKEAQKQEQELKADMEARDKVLKKKTQQLDKVQLELEKLKNLPPDEDTALKLEREKEVVEQLNHANVTYLAATNAFYETVAKIIQTKEVSYHTKEYATQTVARTCEEIVDFLAANGIQIDFQQLIYPEWSQKAAEQEFIGQNKG